MDFNKALQGFYDKDVVGRQQFRAFQGTLNPKRVLVLGLPLSPGQQGQRGDGTGSAGLAEAARGAISGSVRVPSRDP